MQSHRRAPVRGGVASAVFALHLLLPLAAGAADAAGPVASSARAGEFCALGGCRAAAAPWSGVAFGAAVLAIAWTARRRDAER